LWDAAAVDAEEKNYSLETIKKKHARPRAMLNVTLSDGSPNSCH